MGLMMGALKWMAISQVCEGLPAGDYAIKQATEDDVEVSAHTLFMVFEYVVSVRESLCCQALHSM